MTDTTAVPRGPITPDPHAGASRLRVQLWSYNYDPEPTGIGPLSTAWAQAMTARGHEVSVVAAHPHYPEPRWGTRVTPYREIRGGIPVLRLPLWIGRKTTAARLRQEASFSGALAAALPFLPTPDVVVAVSPSFPALLPAMFNARLRRIPWVLWLQDILPDGASATGILREGPLVRRARQVEHLAYESAARIVVISDSFAENLRDKQVPGEKIVRIYNTATRPILSAPRPEPATDAPTVLTMGNVGRSQNLRAVVEAFEANEDLASLGARFVIAGDGVAGDKVRGAIRTDRVEVTGVLDPGTPLEAHLRGATVALVSQQYEGLDFNVPSKLMNFMGYGIPTVAAVRPESEVARIVEVSGGGWVATSPRDCAETLAAALTAPEERQRRGEAALRFAREHFTPEISTAAFEGILAAVARPEAARA